MRKQAKLAMIGFGRACFSPLAGIRYAETFRDLEIQRLILCFSPLAGIRYAETFSQFLISSGLGCFSPLAGIRYAETRRN